MCFLGIPTFSAAERATLIEFGIVMIYLDLAVFRAFVISSVLYAGDAPLIRPPRPGCQSTAIHVKDTNVLEISIRIYRLSKLRT